MNSRRDHLADAIDTVAARMTRVTEDDGLARRIVSALPERPAWSWHWLMPGLAVVGVLAAGGSLFVLTNGRANVPADVQTNVQTNVLPNVQANVQTNVLPNVQTNVLPNARPNDRPNARLNDRLNARPNDRRSDHERSLEAIAPAVSLALVSLLPSELRDQGTLVVEPLAIADLPLTADSFPPR